MSPADGSDFLRESTPVRHLRAPQAILLHGGRAILFFEDADAAPPAAGQIERHDRRVSWTSHSWRSATDDGFWQGIAVLDAVPAAGDLLECAEGPQWRLTESPGLDVASEPLAEFIRRSGACGREVYHFLLDTLLAGHAAGSAAGRASREFLRNFVTSVAEQDGFVEVLAAPHTGGMLVQGWSRSIGAGARCLAISDETGVPLDVDVAHFSRDDILPPGRGFCCFGKSWSAADITSVEALFFETDSRLLRLDVLRGGTVMAGEDATAHVAHMVPRLQASAETLEAFKRVCRPRFAGLDTVSGTTAPVAAAFDAILEAPDGGILTIGWLLDPLRRVERMILKSTANLYVQLDADWCPLPRADLARAFTSDPRFAGLLDEGDAMHGFIAYAPVQREGVTDGEVYLELVLNDGSCLFMPVVVTPFESAERLPQLLQALSPAEPEIGRIVENHLVPFLASVAATPRRPARGAASRPIALGEPAVGRGTVAVIPCESYVQLQPMLALIAGTAEADALDLCVVASRDVASGMLARLEDAFAFYGLGGQLVIAPERDCNSARLDLGVAASTQGRVLGWMPTALPKGPGWLARLQAEAGRLAIPGLLSPALTYEDGSIYFGGAPRHPVAACSLAGYGTAWLHRGAPRRTPAGAAEIALIDRAALDQAGGFSGRLFGDGYAHVDLADRLNRIGLATWCSGEVEFWILDDPLAEAATPSSPIICRIDAALLGRRIAHAAGAAA